MTTDKMIPEGRYLATVTDAVLAHAGNGNEQIAIGFQITAPESDAGRSITYYGSLSNTIISAGKNEGRTVADLTFDALETVGWDCVGFESGSLQTCIGNEASIVVAHEPDNNGNPRARVKFVNSPNGGGAAVKDRVPDNEAANIARKFGGALAKRRQQRSAKQKVNGAPAQPARRPPPPPPFDEYDDYDGPEL